MICGLGEKQMWIAFIAMPTTKRIADNLRDVFPFPYVREDAENFVEACIEADGQGQICRAICVEGEAVGSIGVFVGSDVYRRSAEVGYWLAEPFLGKKAS